MARRFDDASSQYLTRTSAVVAAMPLTMACWFRSNDAAVNQVLMCLGHGSTANNLHALRADGNVAGDPVRAASQAGGAAAIAATTAGYSADVWHHACGVFASDVDRRAFIDGGSKGTNATSRAPTLNRTLVGAQDNAGTISLFTSGDISEAAIWNAALSDAEVADLAKGLSPLLVRPEALVGYWPLIGRFSPEIDRRSGNDLTLTNAPAQTGHSRIIYPSSLRRAVVVTAEAEEISGTLSATLAPATLAATGALEIQAVLGSTLENAGPAATGTLDIAGSLNQTLAPATLAATGALDLTGALSATLQNASLSAQGALAIVGALSQTLADATLVSEGVVGAEPIEGVLSVTLDNATLAAIGALDIQGSVTATLQAATLVASGALEIRAELSRTLEGASLSGNGTLALSGQLAQALADAALSAQGALLAQGSLALTLEGATLSAQGVGEEEEEPAGPPSFTLRTGPWSRSFRTGSTSRSFRTNG